jgi:hypothetical protein
MKILALGLLVFVLSGCSSQYRVFIHDKETKSNHFVLVKKNSGNEICYDCYSRPDSLNWSPACKEVLFIEEK